MENSALRKGNQSQLKSRLKFPKLKTTFVFLIFFVLLACNNTGNNHNKNQHTKDRSLLHSEQLKRQKNRMRVIRILGYLPSPVETSKLIESASLNFDEQLLHDKEKVSSYLIRAKQALNLGIYGSDLGYIKLYERNQYTTSYLIPIKRLAEELGIPSTFTEEKIQIIDTLGDKEKSLEALMNAYKAAEEKLRTSDRNQTAALLVTGGWIEGMYIACESLNTKPSRDLAIRIAEQKYTLQQIIIMLKSVDATPVVNEILTNLKLLTTRFNSVHFDYVQENLLIDSVKHKKFWKNNPEWSLKEKEFNEIRQLVKILRDYATH